MLLKLVENIPELKSGIEICAFRFKKKISEPYSATRNKKVELLNFGKG
jgi:hypothetical protein